MRKHKRTAALVILSFGLSISWAHAEDQALKDLQEAIRTKPADAAAHYNLGNGLLKRGYFDEAISEFQRRQRRFGGIDACKKDN